MKHYQLSERTIRIGMTGMKGWVLYNWSKENEASLWGGGIKRTSKGYIAQEIDRILDNGRS